MAYGVKWFSEFDDIQDNVIYRVEVQERDYGGSATEVTSGRNPIVIEKVKVDNVFTAIRPQKASVEWIADDESGFQIADLFITDDKKYRLQVFEYVSGSPVIRWSGFLVPIECEEPFASKPYPVNFSATCGLPFLSDDYFLDAFGSFVEGKKSLINIIANCLTSTGLELNIDTYSDLFEQNMTTGQSPLAQAEIDADGLRGMKAADVLSGVLSQFGAFITQSNNKWVIKGVREQNNTIAQRHTFSSAGGFVSSGSDIQSASIGREAWTENIPNIRPTSDVVEKLAEPNSIVTQTVNPGIPVNRLFNGTFSGAVLGTIPGWNNRTTGGTSWAREGFGKPEDPYRLVFRSFVVFDPKKKKNIYRPFSYFDTGPIELNVGDFNVDPQDRHDVKVIVSGALKMNNALTFAMYVTINEAEREYASFLDQNGEWFYSKKEDKGVNITTTQKEHGPAKEYEDLEIQTFEVTSKEITNLLKIGGEGVARIRVRVFPGIQGPGYVGNPVFLSIEDLALIVTTDTVYEGEHKYQADGHLAIRNANEVEYTTIVADKINIITPEQSRDVNRVMTGYMTLSGGNNLTQAWKYSTDGSYEPIQKRSLRDRIRLLCGKRRVIEGTFVGYGLRPDMTVFNRYDESGSPSTFYTQTGWKWDLKNAYFDTTIHELDFSPLADEDIYLYDDEGGRRGNRMYRGGASSTTGGKTKDIEEIAMLDLPAVYFTVGIQEIKVVNLVDYLISSHVPNDLIANVDHYDWPSHVGIDRGDDGTGLDVLITAKPIVAGTDRVLIELIGLNGEDFIVNIPLIALPQTKITYQLRDTTNNTILGKITQGAGFMKPEGWRIEAIVSGFHEGYYASVVGPGVSSTVTPYPYLVVDGNDSSTYYLPASGSYIGEVGTYNLDFATFRNEGDPELYAQVKRDEIAFILYDEEYLNKVKFELWVGGSKFGDINPDGSSAFNTEGQPFNVKIIVEGLPHDLATAILTSKGVDYKTHVYTADPAIEDAEYDLYESTPSPQPEGLYELNFNTSDEVTETVYDRLVAFTINKKKPVPQGGSLKLVSMVANTTNYNVMGALSLAGNLFTLPAGGWNVLLDGDVAAGTIRTVELFQKKGASLIDTNIALYTKTSQVTEYSESVDDEAFLIFGTLSSKDIDKIHLDETSFRVRVTDELDGEKTIYSGDFSFGVLEDLDDLPIEEPGNGGDGVQEYYAGRGLSEIVDDYIKTFNVNTDNITLEIFDQTNPSVNWLRVKPKGITHSHYQDITGLSLIGKLTAGTGSPYEVPVITSTTLTGASDLNIFTSLAGKTYIDNKFTSTVTGLAGRLAKFATNSTLTYSILEESGILLTARQGIFVADNASNSSVRGFSVQEGGSTRFSFGKLGSGADFAFWRFADNGATVLGTPIGIERATGKVTLETQLTIQGSSLPPLVVSSSALVVNFNADLLDGQHGTYYLARANHTGTQLASTISNFSSAVLATTLTGLSTSNSAITSSDTILQAFGKVQGQITGNISGTTGRLAKFIGPNAIGTSILEESGILLTARQGIFVADNTSSTNVRGFAVQEGGATRFNFGKQGTAADFAFWRYADDGSTFLGVPIFIERTTGKVTLETQLTIQGSVLAPLVVSSSVLVTNFNADLLDGQHGAYYLDWNNFTNKKSIIAGAGLSGGGLLDSDRTVSLGTPSTLTNATTNSSSGTTHTHAIQVSNLVAGSNVTLSASGTGVILGPNNITISAVSMPWSNITSKPTTLSGFGIVDAPTIGDMNTALAGKENNFSKGNLIQGSGISLSGTLTSRLVNSGDVTVSLATSGVSAGAYNWGTVDAFGRVTSASNVSSGISGTAGYIPQFGSGGTSLVNSVIRDTGTEINIGDTRNFGVEGPAAMRDYLHVHGYANFGTAANHGTILIHQANSGTIDNSAAFEIRSTSKGVLFPRMTTAQRQAISSPAVGLVVYQTDSSGPTSNQGLYWHLGAGVWSNADGSYIGA